MPTMKGKSLFSAAGLIAIAIFLLLAVLVTSLLPSVRVDLTQDKLYSLSDGTDRDPFQETRRASVKGYILTTLSI